MSFKFNAPLTEADKEHNRLMEIVEEISCNMANQVNELRALLSERDLEIQQLEDRLAEARKMGEN